MDESAIRIGEAIHRASRGNLKMFDPNNAEGLERVLLEAFGQTASNLIISYQGRLDLRPAPEIDVFIIDDYRFNAVAFVDKGRGYIGVFRGAFLLIHDLFFRLMAHPQVRPSVGNPTKESVRQFHSEGLKSNYAYLVESRSTRDRQLSAGEPKDPARVQFAFDLIHYALEFLLKHELGHIIHGHCEYRSEENGLPIISEFEFSSEDKIKEDSLTTQAFECDADLFATISSITRQIYPEIRLRVNESGEIIQELHPVASYILTTVRQ